MKFCNSEVPALVLVLVRRLTEPYYLQVTEEHFEKALIPVESEAVDAKTKQNPKQPASASKSADTKKSGNSNSDALPNFTELFPALSKVPVRGLEPPRGCPQWILNPSRLPIPPHRQVVAVVFGESRFYSICFVGDKW